MAGYRLNIVICNVSVENISIQPEISIVMKAIFSDGQQSAINTMQYV